MTNIGIAVDDRDYDNNKIKNETIRRHVECVNKSKHNIAISVTYRDNDKSESLLPNDITAETKSTCHEILLETRVLRRL